MMLLNTSILLYANSVPERRVNQHAQSWEFLLKNRREVKSSYGEKVKRFLFLWRYKEFLMRGFFITKNFILESLFLF